MDFFKAQEVKSQLRTGIEATTGLSQVVKAILQTQPDERIVQDGHDVTGIAKGQTSGIIHPYFKFDQRNDIFHMASVSNDSIFNEIYNWVYSLHG